MSKRGKRARGEAAGNAGSWRGSAAAVAAFLSRPIVKELTVKAIVATVTAAARSETVRGFARRARGRPEPVRQSTRSGREEKRT